MNNEQKTFNSISLKPVNEFIISEMKFFIPDYQRGYRWTDQQVEDLLNDIYEFETKEFYCLQPLVIREMKKKEKEDHKLKSTETWYEVIDGQQRLTTIFLILKYLKCEKLYSLSYATRKDSENFLSEIKNKIEEDAEENIDFFHMWKAYHKTIKSWLKGKDFDKTSFLEKLLKNVYFIWYESLEKKPVEVFSRLNSGKISLTNGELIKALFLNRSEFKKNKKIQEEQNKIAKEWNEIESEFQKQEFWLFLQNKGSEYANSTRIDLIFDLMFKKKNDNDSYETFRYFYECLDNAKDKLEEINRLWKEVVSIFQTLQKWYNDLRLYHYIGYLILYKHELRLLLKEWRKKEDEELFLKYLKSKIKSEIGKYRDLDIPYDVGSDYKSKCKPLLLLHNIQTVIDEAKGNGRKTWFPFDIYKLTQTWDVEHIDSNKTNELKKKKDQDEWLKTILKFIGDHKDENIIGKDLEDEMREFLRMTETSEAYNEKFDEIKEKLPKSENSFGEYDERKDQIMNFALLSSSINREYKNSIFSVKSRVIKEHEKSDFIPPCTKKVFNKEYKYESTSDDPNYRNYWDKLDAIAYKKDIYHRLKKDFGVTTEDKEVKK